MKIDVLEFIRRFLQHSLPSGFMKVRYYGFMHPCCSVPLEKIRASIELIHGFDVEISDSTEGLRKKTAPVCPDCGCEMRYICSVLPHEMPHYRGAG